MEKLIGGAARLGIVLTSRQLEQFQAYYQELVYWNQRFNLTAIVDYQEVQIKHFLDSLTVSLALVTNVLDQGHRCGQWSGVAGGAPQDRLAPDSSDAAGVGG